MSKIKKITERRIVTWDCANCQANLGTIETLNKDDVHTKNVKVICPDCDMTYCLHWGYNGFETWVEDWETYATRHARHDAFLAQGHNSFE